MRMKTLILGATGALVATAPIVAQAANFRAAAPVAGESELGYPESGTQLIVLALIAGVIIAGISLTDDEPSSP